MEDPSTLSPEEFLKVLVDQGIFEGQEGILGQLRALVAQGVHPMQVLKIERNETPPADGPVLGSFDLEGVAQYIAKHGCKRIVVMCGAGISTSAGIPDFRTPGTGLYDNLQRFDLPVAEAIFDLDYFREKPAAFYELCRELWPGNYQPTPAHYFVKLLHDKGLLLRCYSQNIDSLEVLAGLPTEKLIAAHGNFDAAHVIDTQPEQLVDIAELKVAVEKGEEGWRELAAKKGNLVKPKIVFFGEELPERFANLHIEDLAKCDLLLVLGTSLVVMPFAGLVSLPPPLTPRVLINREMAGTSDTMRKGFRFHLEGEGQNWRDVWHGGDCDNGCSALAAALGWKEDLDALVASRGTASVDRAPWAPEEQDASQAAEVAVTEAKPSTEPAEEPAAKP